MRLIAGLVSAQTAAMLGTAAFATTLVTLAALWHLDATRAGWISSAYLVGYVMGVPLLVAMTDRLDPRFIFLAGCTLGVIANASFAFFADGLWSAFCFQALAGVALSGTYMPGLRLLTGRLKLPTRIRAVPYYTAAFGVGTSLSFLVSGWMAAHYGWQAAFIAGAAGSICAAVLAMLASVGVALERDLNAVVQRRLLDFRPALHNRKAVAYMLGYSGHCWELFAFRAWLPTYLLFAWRRVSTAGPGVILSRWAMLIVLVGVPASIVGAEIAERGVRDRLIRWFELASIGAAALSAFCASLSFGAATAALFIYNIAITADSGALTAGTVAAALPGEQGATLALYSLVGFGGGALGPLAVGSALDRAGGFNSRSAWYPGFAMMALGSALAAIAISMVSAAGESAGGQRRRWIGRAPRPPGESHG